MTWTLERIYARCEEDEGCMLWQGGLSKRYPICQEPAPDRPHGQRQVHVRRKVWELAKGKPAPGGPRYVLVASCGQDLCVAAGCVQLMTKSERLRLAAEGGRSLAYRAAVSAARTRDSKLSDQVVATIRGSTELLKTISGRHGISTGYASALRSGQARRDYTSPWAALQPARTRRQA